MSLLPDLGVGIMYLPGLDDVVAAVGDLIDVLEVEPQPFSTLESGRYRMRAEIIEHLDSLPQRKLVHGVGAPVAGSVLYEPLLRPYMETAQVLKAPWASEHLTFNRVSRCDGSTYFTGFMLPPLQTLESVDVAVNNIKRIKDELGVPFAFETPVNYLHPRPDEMPDGQFFAEVALKADCGILLDLYNIWCNEQNGRQAVSEVLEALPLDRVWEMHLADGRQVDGYWVDAHSGLISEAMLERAEQVAAQLPNLKAIIFEIMPDYIAAQGITIDDILRQAERMRTIWNARGSAVQAATTRDVTLRGLNSEVAVGEWEQALGGVLTRQASSDRLSEALDHDPGLQVYRKLIESVRAGMIVDTLTLTYRLSWLSRGDEGVDALLNRFWDAHPPHQAAIDEARAFAVWLETSGHDVPHLDEVAAYEIARHEAAVTCMDQIVTFTREPLGLLEALGEGRLPEDGPMGRYELVVEWG